MTTQELDELLVREKKNAEKALGCDMCKKYARCLYCFSKDEFRCAMAHNRLFSAMQRGVRKIPPYLLPEPPIEELISASKTADQQAHKPAAAKPSAPVAKTDSRQAVKGQAYEEKESEEMIETVAHILSEFNMKSLPEDRARELKKISAMMDSADESPKTIYRTQRLEGDVPILRITRKKQ